MEIVAALNKSCVVLKEGNVNVVNPNTIPLINTSDCTNKTCLNKVGYMTLGVIIFMVGRFRDQILEPTILGSNLKKLELGIEPILLGTG